MTTRLIYCFCMLLIQPALAQVEQSQRIEIAVSDEDNDFGVVSAKDRGIVLYREVKNTDTRMEHKYQVMLIDTTLHKSWENYYFIHLRYIIRGYEYYGKYFYLLFQRNTESLKADLFVLRIDLETKASETMLIEREYSMDLTDFEVLGNTLFFGGYSNNLPTIVSYVFGKPQPKVLPGLFNERTQIQHIEVDDKKQICNVLVNYRTPRNRLSLSLKSFDEAGNLIKNVNLKPSEDHSLLYARTIKLSDNADLVVGTYAYKKSELSRGIFLARISDQGEQVINYYNYADLKNFFSYMKAKRQHRIEERIKRRKIKGKKNRFNYRLLVHDVIEKDGKFIMVGEAYYPKYSQSSYFGGYNYSNYGNNFSAFEGYKYTHAVVFGFDRRGRLIWDNSFQISDIVSYQLNQYVHVSTSRDAIALIYMFDNEIRSKIIRGNQVMEGKTYNSLKLSFENDEVSETRDKYGGIEEWYNGNLFAYGIHKIKNIKDQGVKLNREVFFINKINYQ